MNIQTLLDFYDDARKEMEWAIHWRKKERIAGIMVDKDKNALEYQKRQRQAKRIKQGILRRTRNGAGR